jgi:hypothetical protein
MSIDFNKRTSASQYFLTINLLLSAIIGHIAWSGHMTGLMMLPAIFCLWGSAHSRTAAYAVASAYYLGCSYPLIHGTAVFYQNPLTHDPSITAGIALWGTSSLLLALPWGVLWGSSYITLRICSILLLLSLPPIGIIGWGNPLTAAGLFFPGYGWYGIALTLALFIVSAQISRHYRIMLPLLALSIIANLSTHPKQLPAGWVAINTQLGWLQGTTDDYQHHQQLITLANTQMKPATRVILFPEMITGAWTENSTWLWRNIIQGAKRNHTTILIGTTISSATGNYSNVLLPLGDAIFVPLPDRVPVPISMWKPWAKNGAVGYFTHNGIHIIAGRKVASLICYEQLLIWPVLHSMFYKPGILLGAANDWWAKDTVIPAIQQEALHAWGRLFDVPVLSSINQ